MEGLQTFDESKGIEGLKEALRWDSSHPDFYFRLGLLHRDRVEYWDPAVSAAHLQKAAELNPFNWRYWFEMGRSYEMAGLRQQSERAYNEALKLNPLSPTYHWRIGNFYIRNGEPQKATRHLQVAIAHDASLRIPCLELLWKLGMSPPEIDRIWPDNSNFRLELLRFLVGKYQKDRLKSDLFLQRKWQALLQAGSGLAVKEGEFYLNYLLSRNKHQSARNGWVQMLKGNGVADPDYESKRNFVWRGDFSSASTSGLLDWKFSSSKAFSVMRVPTEGVRATPGMKVEFRGTENPDFRELRQQIIVDPGQDYELSFFARSEGITTEQGLFINITDETGASFLRTEQIRGTTPWRRYAAEFHIPSDVSMVWLELRRQPSSKIDNLLSGIFWLDAVRLQIHPATAGRNLASATEVL